jgi:2-keto-3-deoxy-L-fuconate dehydrogenase
MSGRLAGKSVLITAAGQGIGRATALRFLAEGATVWATDINPAALDTLAAEKPSIHTRILNVRDSASVIAVAEQIGAIDVLFNCAGYVHQGTVLECSEHDWDVSYDLNVTSMYRTAGKAASSTCPRSRRVSRARQIGQLTGRRRPP